MKKLGVFIWNGLFTERQESMQNYSRSGQLKMKRTDANVDKVRTLVHNVTLLQGIQENDFQDYFRQWHHRLMSYIALQGISKATAAASPN
jgi:hypothetical protein